MRRVRLLPLYMPTGLLLAGTRTALRVFPLRLVRAWVWRLAGASSPLPLRKRRTEDQLLRALAAAEKYSPVGSTCLAVALVGKALLARHGYASELRIGVRRDAKGEFFAHAWLERAGKIVIGGPASVVQNYTALPEMEHLIA